MKSCFNAISVLLAVSASSVVAAPVIDTFETDQTAADIERSGVAGAVSMVRHIEGLVSGFFGAPSVAGGQFRCDDAGIGAAACVATYDNVDDDAADINNGTLGTGTAGGGLDFWTGLGELTILVTEFSGDANTGSISFSSRNYTGTLCTASVSGINGTGPVVIPFNATPGCLASTTPNPSVPLDVRGFSIQINVNGSGSFIAIDMPEATPVELLDFDVD